MEKERKFIDVNTINLDKNPAFYYRSPERRYSLYASLAAFGCKLFDGAYKIKYFDKFKKLCEDIWSDKAQDGDIFPFMEEHVLDQIRIITCFENIYKGVLLNEGFLIHVVSNEPDFLELHRQQKKRPIRMDEVINNNNLFVKDGLDHFKGLTTKTINISTILDKEEYMNALSMSRQFFDLLKEINEERNSLHMLMKTEIHFSNELNRLTLLKQLVGSVKEQLEKIDKSHTEFQIIHSK